MINEVKVSKDFSHAVYEYYRKLKDIKIGIYETTLKIYTSMDFQYVKNEGDLINPIESAYRRKIRLNNFINFWAMYKLNDIETFSTMVKFSNEVNKKCYILTPDILLNLRANLPYNENDELVDYVIITINRFNHLTIIQSDFLSCIE